MTSSYFKCMFLISSFESGLVGLLLARVANTVFLTGMCLRLFESTAPMNYHGENLYSCI